MRNQVGCVMVPVIVGRGHMIWIPGSRHSCHARKDLEPQGALIVTGGARFYHLVPEAPFFRRMPTGLRGNFGTTGRVWGYGPVPSFHIKKNLVPTCMYVGVIDKYQEWSTLPRSAGRCNLVFISWKNPFGEGLTLLHEIQAIYSNWAFFLIFR